MHDLQGETAVRAAQQAWGRALVARDTGALQALLDDELAYIHATGLMHDRAGYLRYVQSGPSFLSVGLAEARVLMAPGLAVIEGMLELTLQRPGEPQPQSLRSFATQVWRPGASGWRLRRAQTTRPAN